MLTKLDIFGSQIQLRFNKYSTYKTKFGSFVTILIIGFIFFRLFFIIQDVVQRVNPQVIYSERQVDDPAPFQVSSETFPIAFGMEDTVTSNYYIDESIYTVSASWNQKVKKLNETSNLYEQEWQKVNIELKPCTQENFKNKDNLHYYLKLNYTNMYCLPPDSIFQIQGDYTSDIYSEIQLKVKKCTQNCKPDDVINKQLLNSNFAMQLSDSYVDPTVKDNPFKVYSRDMFWPTSILMPKIVYLYLRNNYVYSDFGWFFSDFISQRFPAYSFYESSIFPPQFQDYYLSIVFRFEKQKEGSFKRSYQSFNNIISEIGGFTQSLLAIGYLICTKVSQLKLNQRLIKQAFNFEDSVKSDNNTNEKQIVVNELKEKLRFNKQNNTQQMNTTQQLQAEYTQINQNQFSPHRKLTDLKKRFDISVSGQNSRKHSVINTPTQSYQSATNIQIDQQSQFQFLHKTKQKNENQLFDLKFRVSDLNQKTIESSNKVNEQGIKIQDLGKQINLQDCKTSSPNRRFSKKQKDTENRNITQNEQKQILGYLLSEKCGSFIRSPSKKNTEILQNLSQKQANKLKKIIQKQDGKLVEDYFQKLMNEQTNSMKMTVWDYFKSLIFPFGKMKKKQKIIDYSLEKLYQKLDIFYIVKKLFEVDKLKRLLLDSDQIQLFEYMPKPTINPDIAQYKSGKDKQQSELDLLYQDNRSEIEKAKDAYFAYKNILNKQDPSILDYKIMNLLDSNLIGIFGGLSSDEDITNNNSIKDEASQENASESYSPQYKMQQTNNTNYCTQEFQQIKCKEKCFKVEILSNLSELEKSCDQVPIEELLQLPKEFYSKQNETGLIQ
ncbi:transmembrane protein, putative (macronuclear) [Tetrahymena thermophila SB210]|uniref:Transmembrane protein, putative n=1 Tax=Tetrahymena thermophila (strain SB210) TaxID=312017 RepID=Q235Y0_TETTS|nr:transmembrane protein, putative [Tetrahymena thermophila SB210]EAR92620.2 transmembrane protein, putative [Tetrahymena thermophila SB210]|eukprot:XP_001012865.2 transmembrane protein, putative [Tetrahymena thermophila SB210]